MVVVAPSSRPDSRNPVTLCSCSSETSGPICVPGSMPGPSLMPLAISATPLTTSSNLSSWTNRREPATQHWPWLKKIALAATVLPVVRAGPSFHAAISSGKFHGMICPTR